LKGYTVTNADGFLAFWLIGQLAASTGGILISRDVTGSGRWYGGEWTSERVILLLAFVGVFFSHFFRLWDIGNHKALEISTILSSMLECFSQFMFAWQLSNPFSMLHYRCYFVTRI
jgi:hypothetical protein